MVGVSRPESGWSNETVVLTVECTTAEIADPRLVVRIPPVHPVFPDHDPRVEASVLEALAAGPVPVPRVMGVGGEEWLGAPFLAMSFVSGRPGPEVPAFDPWLSALPVDRQRRLHEAFVGSLARLHGFDWEGAGLGALRGGDGQTSLSAEVDWWSAYVDWATDGDPPPRLVEAVAWCRATVPVPGPPSLCWGDARLGNLLIDEDLGVTALLDWERASIGPPQMDLAWYLALEGVVERLTGKRVPGFLDRDELVASYEARCGRPVGDLVWHEIFALVRSVAISERLARLAVAGRSGYRGPVGDGNPVLVELGRHLEAAVADR